MEDFFPTFCFQMRFLEFRNSSVFLFQTSNSHLSFLARARPQSGRCGMGRAVAFSCNISGSSFFCFPACVQVQFLVGKKDRKHSQSFYLTVTVVVLFWLILDSCHQNLGIGAQCWYFENICGLLGIPRGDFISESSFILRFPPIQPTSSIHP